MLRSRFFLSISLAVVLIGLLIFFNTSNVSRFFHTQIFRSMSLFMHPVHALRLWGSRVMFSYQNVNGDMNVDDHKKLEVATAMVQQLIQENDRLRSALALRERSKASLKGASVLYYGREFGREFLLIDQGENDNVANGDIVLDANGLFIGTIKDAEDSFSKVGIAANNENVFDVELLPSGVKSFAKGLGNRTFSLELLPQNTMVRAGDYVMAKGSKTTFLLAQVVRAEASGAGVFREVWAVLLSHPELEEEVFVVLSK